MLQCTWWLWCEGVHVSGFCRSVHVSGWCQCTLSSPNHMLTLVPHLLTPVSHLLTFEPHLLTLVSHLLTLYYPSTAATPWWVWALGHHGRHWCWQCVCCVERRRRAPPGPVRQIRTTMSWPPVITSRSGGRWTSFRDMDSSHCPSRSARSLCQSFLPSTSVNTYCSLLSTVVRICSIRKLLTHSFIFSKILQHLIHCFLSCYFHGTHTVLISLSHIAQSFPLSPPVVIFIDQPIHCHFIALFNCFFFTYMYHIP